MRGLPSPGFCAARRLTSAGVGILPRFRSGGLVHQGVLVFCASMFLAACGFGFHAVASRGLGVREYGALYALISAFMSAGLPGAVMTPVIVRFAAEFRALHDEGHLRGLAAGIAVLCCVFGVLVLAVSIVLSGPIGTFLHVPQWLVPLIGAMTAFGFASTAFRSFVQGMQAYGAFSISSIAEGAVKVLGIVAFLALGLGVVGGAVALVIGSIASSVCLWFYLARRFRSTGAVAVKYDWKRIAIAGGGAASLTVATTFLGSLDVVLVKHYFDPTQAGIYSVASLVGKVLLYFVGFIPTILLPQAADRHSRGERTRIVLGACLGMFALVSICGLLFFHFFGIVVLHALAGRAFDAAAGLLVPYGAAMVCLSFISALGTYGIATHRMLFAAPLTLCTLGILSGIVAYHPTLTAVVHVLLSGTAGTMAVVAICLAVQGIAGERARMKVAA